MLYVLIWCIGIIDLHFDWSFERHKFILSRITCMLFAKFCSNYISTTNFCKKCKLNICIIWKHYYVIKLPPFLYCKTHSNYFLEINNCINWIMIGCVPIPCTINCCANHFGIRALFCKQVIYFSSSVESATSCVIWSSTICNTKSIL